MVMKKFLSVICGVLLVGILAITFTSCSKEEKVSPMVKKLKFNVNVVNGSATDTKVVKSSWENGDKIYLFFNVSGTGHLDAIKYATLTYNGTSWDGAIDAGSSLDAEDLGSAGTMYGVFFPFGGVDIESDGASGVTFRTKGNTNPVLNGLPIFTYYMTGNAPYTVVPSGDIANLDGTITLTMPDDFVYFFVDKSGSDYNANEKYRLSAEGLKPVACSSFSAGVFSETSLVAGQPVWGYTYASSGIAFTGKIDATWASATDHKFIFFSDGDPAQSITFNKALTSHKSIKLKAPIAANGWEQAVATPTTIDLGTSTCLWADRNLGAVSGMVPGWYLGWGQLVPCSDYTYNNWYPNGVADITTDLVGNYAIYDAARAYFGAGWRLPTCDETDEILDGTAVYDMGLDYVTLTRNANTIYFPITNYYKQSDPEGGDYDVGYFWTSSIYPSDSCPYYFYVDRYCEEIDYYYWPVYKDRAFTVRPVKDK